MIADFYPWKIDVDIEATKQFYDENDWSEDRAANQKFCDVMTGKQKQFFSALGIDIHKVKAEERVHEIPDEEETPGGKIYVRTLDFLFCGTFLSIPDYQWNLYNDEEIVGMRLPETLEVVEMPEYINIFRDFFSPLSIFLNFSSAMAHPMVIINP